MIATDFEYDGLYLSDFGYLLGAIDGSTGVEEISAGSEISFSLVSANRGNTSYHISSKYDNYLETELTIIKNPCDSNDYKISQQEFRNLMRWLNRKDFHKLKFIYDDNEGERDDVFFYASFNCSKLVLNDDVVGVKLIVQTNAPYGYGKTVDERKTVTIGSGASYTEFSIIDTSDEIGETFPVVTATMSSAGTFTLLNTTYDEYYLITVSNCISGETITIDNEHQVITSSNASHNVANDFNFHWFRLVNTFNNRTNKIRCYIPCSLKITYEPIIKYGF